jgi:hypothetical protein
VMLYLLIVAPLLLGAFQLIKIPPVTESTVFTTGDTFCGQVAA